MRVAYVTLVDLSGTSGQNVYSRHVAAGLGRHPDVELTLICPEPASSLPHPVAEKAATVRHLPTKRSRSLRWHAAVQWPLLEALRASRPATLDGVVSTHRPSLVVPPLFARYHSLSYRLIVEGNITAETRDAYSAPMVGLMTDLVSALNFVTSERVYAVNDEVRAWVETFSRRGPVQVLPHGVDIAALENATGYHVPVADEVPSDAFVVGYVGSFKPYHCLDALLRASAALRADGLDVHLLLVGTGPERDAVSDLARDLGIEDATTFTGFVDPSRLGAYLSLTDVCYGIVDPDRTGSPMKVYEYLGASRPVVATNSAELSFVRECGAGRLLEAVTADSVEAALRELHALGRDELAAMGAAGREYLERRGHTWDDIAQTLVRGMGS